MKPPAFEYAAPATVAEAVGLLAERGFDAKILAGGQSLMALLNMRLARPELLVDIARVPGLDSIEISGDCLGVGAMARQRSLEFFPGLGDSHPLLLAGLRHVAHPQNRNQGTVCGSLAHADPAAELPALALATDAELFIEGPNGRRSERAEDFFVTYLTTTLEEDELLVEARFPLPAEGSGWSVQEVTRRHGDFALAGAVVTLRIADARVADPRVVAFGVGAVPLRCAAAEQSLDGAEPGPAAWKEAAALVAEAVEDPLDDVHASAAQRRSVAGVMAARAMEQAATRA
ncbi:MAG TPA: xanthine dehydrogenase family protein subunit M [Deltaproteobacteria bacterium]|nr:xanthine dehydrogenase family protein subunit M [Candidatus Binatota bacterium]HIL13648.1 xanthine dehydrogenase family protein subunit M [Deltaproteobacteria bacterium]